MPGRKHIDGNERPRVELLPNTAKNNKRRVGETGKHRRDSIHELDRSCLHSVPSANHEISKHLRISKEAVGSGVTRSNGSRESEIGHVEAVTCTVDGNAKPKGIREREEKNKGERRKKGGGKRGNGGSAIFSTCNFTCCSHPARIRWLASICKGNEPSRIISLHYRWLPIGTSIRPLCQFKPTCYLLHLPRSTASSQITPKIGSSKRRNRETVRNPKKLSCFRNSKLPIASS